MGTSSIVRTPGDYVIFAPKGGVVIDVNNTGTNIRPPNTGTVTIYGNLDVIGGTTYIETTNTNILDNIIVLNKGETANNVSLGTAGILISRSVDANTGSAATLLFDDTVYWQYDNVTSTRGIWEFAVGDGVGPKISAIKVNAIRIGSNQLFLNLFGQDNPLGMLNVKGTLNYETRVLDDDDIPNKKYVDDRLYTGNEFSKRLRLGNNFVDLYSNTISPSDPYYSLSNKIVAGLGTSTNIVFKLEDSNALIQGITIVDTVITVNPNRNSANLTLTPYSSTGTVEITSSITLSNVPKPDGMQDATQVFSTSTIGGGGTGLYYVNTNNSDELVSRKRAIIYGIIF